jgi:hypothetical protein
VGVLDPTLASVNKALDEGIHVAIKLGKLLPFPFILGYRLINGNEHITIV